MLANLKIAKFANSTNFKTTDYEFSICDLMD